MAVMTQPQSVPSPQVLCFGEALVDRLGPQADYLGGAPANGACALARLGTSVAWLGRLGNDGVWDGDYGWGVRVRRPFGARGMSSVRYGTRLGDLKENWFLLFSN